MHDEPFMGERSALISFVVSAVSAAIACHAPETPPAAPGPTDPLNGSSIALLASDVVDSSIVSDAGLVDGASLEPDAGVPLSSGGRLVADEPNRVNHRKIDAGSLRAAR